MKILANTNASGRAILPFLLASFIAWVVGVLTQAAAEGVASPVEQERYVLLELYHDGESDAVNQAKAVLAELRPANRGLLVFYRDLREEINRNHYQTIIKYYRVEQSDLPLVYWMNQVTRYSGDAKQFLAQCRAMLSMEVFVRRGCHHCENAKRYLIDFTTRYPAIQIEYHDLVTQPEAAATLNALVRQHKKSAASVPVFHACNQLLIGFESPESTGPRVEKLFERWTAPCPAKTKRQTTSLIRTAPLALSLGDILLVNRPPAAAPEQPELALLFPDSSTDGSEEPSELHASESSADRQIDLPWFGKINVNQIGLAAFTIAIGLTPATCGCCFFCSACWSTCEIANAYWQWRDRLWSLAALFTLRLWRLGSMCFCWSVCCGRFRSP